MNIFSLKVFLDESTKPVHFYVRIVKCCENLN